MTAPPPVAVLAEVSLSRATLGLQQTDPFSLVGRLLDSPYTKAALAAAVLVVATLYLALVCWTFRDASRRGGSRLPWALVSLLFPFLGPLVYLLLRPPDYALDVHERELELLVLQRVLAEGTQRCSRCEGLVRSDYLGCPHCGQPLREKCAGCGRPLEEEWGACPYCLTARRSNSSPTRSPDRAERTERTERTEGGGRVAARQGSPAANNNGRGRSGRGRKGSGGGSAGGGGG